MAHLNFDFKSTLLKINQAWGQICAFAKLFQLCILECSDMTDMDWVPRRKIRPISFCSLPKRSVSHLWAWSADTPVRWRHPESTHKQERDFRSAGKCVNLGVQAWSGVLGKDETGSEEKRGVRLSYWLLDVTKSEVIWPSINSSS